MGDFTHSLPPAAHLHFASGGLVRGEERAEGLWILPAGVSYPCAWVACSSEKPPWIRSFASSRLHS